MPYLAGVEGVGLIVEVGSEVTDLFEGQRVGWLTGGQGSFADYTVVEAARAVPIPDEVDNELAAAVLMQGSQRTTWRRTPIRSGQATRS
jgi:NADPH2:quinone reductase